MKHILIIENDPLIIQELEKILCRKYKVTVINSGKNLEDYLKSNTPDLILLAADISGEDYHTTLNVIMDSKISLRIPVMMLLSSKDRSLEQEVNALEIADVITKPIVEFTLLKRISNCLELQEYRNGWSEAEKFQDALSVSFAQLVEFRDEATGGHIINTTRYFRILLDEVMKRDKYKGAISQEDYKSLQRSASLHDIGKIGISDKILRKASSLDYNEYEYMKTHTLLGKMAFEKIIRETGGSRWLYMARDIAYCHHERWDGNGYPNGLKGEDIPLYARILSIADVYDALTSKRCYKKAFSHEEAVKTIAEGRGKIFDPDLVDIFLETNQKFKEVLIGIIEAASEEKRSN